MSDSYGLLISRGAGTILYVGGPTNQNKCCGNSGGWTNT